MRQIVTGVDADGRSCVIAEHPQGVASNDFTSSSGDRMSSYTAFETASSPAPPRPAGNGQFMDLEVPVGFLRFSVVHWPPGAENPMHHTDSIDFDTVLEGSIDIILEDGRHHLEVGDAVIVTGVDHAWEAGPSGATLSVFVLGTPRPA